MSWKCSCKQVNDDNSSSCCNCARKKPKYLGVKVDFEKKEFSSEELSIWYLIIANNYLKIVEESNSQIHGMLSNYGIPPYKNENLNIELRKLKNSVILNSDSCLKFIDEATKIHPTAQFKDDDEVVHNSNSLKSLCYYELGSVEYSSANYSKALDFFQKSFNSEPNQISIFQIALATMNLPVEGGSIFGGKKTEEAKENKKNQEILLLKKTIQFAPFSNLGIKCASILYENFGILVNHDDLSKK